MNSETNDTENDEQRVQSERNIRNTDKRQNDRQSGVQLYPAFAVY